MITPEGYEGRVVSTEVVAVQKNLTLEMDIDQYDETEVRLRLAEVYGIAADRISLDLSAGSVQLVVTFLPSEATSNSSVADSLTSLIRAVQAYTASARQTLLDPNAEALGPASSTWSHPWPLLALFFLTSPQAVTESNLSIALNATVDSSSAPTQRTLTRTAVTISCPDGYYCEPGAAAPIACPAGTHSNVSIPMMTSKDECITCSAGTYCPVGSAVPTDCAPGTFNPNARQALCHRCSAGSYQDKEGALECKTCDAGAAKQIQISPQFVAPNPSEPEPSSKCTHTHLLPS